jgi:hypothetical protein
VLQLLEQSGIDHRETKADPAFVSHPDNSSFSLKDSFSTGERETYIEQPGKAHRFL